MFMKINLFFGRETVMRFSEFCVCESEKFIALVRNEQNRSKSYESPPHERSPSAPQSWPLYSFPV